MDTNILLESGTNELEILEFMVGGNYYGINVAKINELCPYQEPTMVPNAHEYIDDHGGESGKSTWYEGTDGRANAGYVSDHQFQYGKYRLSCAWCGGNPSCELGTDHPAGQYDLQFVEEYDHRYCESGWKACADPGF